MATTYTTIGFDKTNAQLDSIKTTETHLELLTHSFITAINKRDFSPTSPSYKNVAPTFIFELDALQRYDLATFLKIKHRMSLICPNFSIQIQDMSTTINEAFGTATVFTNIVWKNILRGANGLMLPGVCVTEFQQRLEGDWFVTRMGFPTGPDLAGDILNVSLVHVQADEEK